MMDLMRVKCLIMMMLMMASSKCSWTQTDILNKITQETEVQVEKTL